jgi:hypothetical protein
MFAQGFKRRMLANLIRAGLATAQRENMRCGPPSRLPRRLVAALSAAAAVDDLPQF